MAEFYKLENEVKHYAWGSPDLIPVLTGKANPERKPWAELWMGTHSGGPSKTTVRGKTVLLSEISPLPFLFKFLAAESPLSIQAHPNSIQAREGFERENNAGIPLSDPKRNYRDPNHKPEITCALNSFTAMAGFRETAETSQLLSLVDGTNELRSALKDGYLAFLSMLFELKDEEKKALNSAVLACESQKLKEAEKKDYSPLCLCAELARIYPNDPGIISPLYLNVIELKPFEAIFLPAGILHAYIHGFAMECMANSDNVLRGGLTPKHIDVKELFSVLSFDPYKPEILRPIALPSPGCYRYASSCNEFSLYLIQNPVSGIVSDPASPGTQELEVPEMGIFAVYDGRAEISLSESRAKNAGQDKNGSLKKIVLNKGESVFISRREAGESLVFSGDFTLLAALGPE